jgi:hypothetical protein
MWKPQRFPTTGLRKIPIERTFRQSRSVRKQRSRDQNTPSCYRCGRSHQGTSNQQEMSQLLKMGHCATNCKAPKATVSATSTSSALMGQLTIATALNHEKLDQIEVKVGSINGRRDKAKFLPDTAKICNNRSSQDKLCGSWG